MYSLIKYLSKKTLVALLTLFTVVTITFFLMRLIPGHIYSGDIAPSSAVIRNIEARYRLDEPIFVQYVGMLKNISYLNLGTSMAYEGRSVNDILITHFPLSGLIGIISIVISVFFGISVGILLAVAESKLLRSMIISFVTLGMALPSFVAAILLQFFFSIQIPIFPILGGRQVIGLILPVIALSLYPTAFIARSVYYDLKEILRKDYIIAARARGIPEQRVLYIHALKNALLPLLSYVGPLLASFLVGSFAIETIFNIPGLGRYFIISIAVRDYTTIMGVTIFYSALFIVISLALDTLYGLLDPRIRKII